MGCCNTHQLDRKELELAHGQVSKSTPRSSASHEFKDVSLESQSDISLESITENPFPLPLYADPVQSYKYFIEGRHKRFSANLSYESSKGETTVSKYVNRSFMLNVSQQEEEPSVSWKLKLETSLADLQNVSLCQNIPHGGDDWLSPQITRSPGVEGSNLSSISMDEEREDYSSIDFAGIEEGDCVGEINVS